MKRDSAGSMRTIGSLTLCRSLLEAGLVDRFRVVVFPVITGRTGRDRIYDAYPDVALDMVDGETFDGRIQLLEHVPTGAHRSSGHAPLTTPATGSSSGCVDLATSLRQEILQSPVLAGLAGALNSPWASA